MSQADTIKFAQSNVALGPAPISKDWVIEGSPTARIRQIFRSVDGESETFIWDCTAGKFNWYYSVDETVYVIEGSVIVEDEAGVAHELTAGSTMFFPKGSAAKWHVPKYIRKVAFRDKGMKDGIELKVINRLRQVTAGMKQAGENQVAIIRSGADKEASARLGQAAAVRPKVIGAVLAAVGKKPSVAKALFSLLDLNATLKSPGKTIIAPAGSTSILLNMG